ncbi:MAG: DUF2284 domain-containing protein [Clostridia bacterium]
MNIEEMMLKSGAFKIGKVMVGDIVCNKEFRKACESNTCGTFNKCWACPPCIGDIDDCIAKVKSFSTAIVYQTVGEIEDSYDFEGMMEIGAKHNELDLAVSDFVRENLDKDEYLHLGAGKCGICKKCAKIDNQPCRFPDKMMSSLEAHGIAVSSLAESAGMKYMNGQNSVTYFGAVFLK